MVTQDKNIQPGESTIVRPLEEEKTMENTRVKKYIIGVYILVILIGIWTGYLLSNSKSSSNSQDEVTNTVTSGKSVGSSDTLTFKDSAVGAIEKGGLDGEGTHKLIRDGGPSQTVYLTSSVVDLDQFAGKKVKVWGQTMAAQKAAWLMDVGKVDIQ